MTSAIAGFGIQLKIGTVAIAELQDVSGPSLSLETIEVTSHSSVEGWKEYIAGLLDAGEISFDINYVPTNATHKNAAGGLIYILAQRAVQAFSLVFPDTTTWTFNAFVTAFEPSAPVADKLSASVTLKLTGKPTLV